MVAYRCARSFSSAFRTTAASSVGIARASLLGRRDGLLARDSDEGRHLGVGGQRAHARRKLVEHSPESKHVSATIERLGEGLLGGKIVDFAFDKSRLGSARSELGGLGHTEMGDFGDATARQQNVLGRDVAMNDSKRRALFVLRFVGGVKPPRRIHDHAHRDAVGQLSPFRQQHREGIIHRFHDEVDEAFVFAEVEHRAARWGARSAKRVGLRLQTSPENADPPRATEASVLTANDPPLPCPGPALAGGPNRSHPPAGDGYEQFVLAESLPSTKNAWSPLFERGDVEFGRGCHRRCGFGLADAIRIHSHRTDSPVRRATTASIGDSLAKYRQERLSARLARVDPTQTASPEPSMSVSRWPAKGRGGRVPPRAPKNEGNIASSGRPFGSRRAQKPRGPARRCVGCGAAGEMLSRCRRIVARTSVVLLGQSLPSGPVPAGFLRHAPTPIEDVAYHRMEKNEFVQRLRQTRDHAGFARLVKQFHQRRDRGPHHLSQRPQLELEAEIVPTDSAR